MSRELNDSELKNLNGGEGGILSEDTVEKLGLTVHSRNYCCGSFTLTPRNSDKDHVRNDCWDCMYSALIVAEKGSGADVMACLLCK